MNKFFAMFPIALFAIVVSAADAPAPPPNQPAPPENQPSAQQSDALKKGEQTLHYRQRTVTGKVADLKETEVTPQGKPAENHMLAKVNTHEGRTVIVDLGPRNALRNEIKTGDEIAAFGITGRMNERPLIVAHRVGTVLPIEGREEIYESLPADYQPTEGLNSSERVPQDTIRRSIGPPPFLRECEDR